MGLIYRPLESGGAPIALSSVINVAVEPLQPRRVLVPVSSVKTRVRLRGSYPLFCWGTQYAAHPSRRTGEQRYGLPSVQALYTLKASLSTTFHDMRRMETVQVIFRQSG